LILGNKITPSFLFPQIILKKTMATTSKSHLFAPHTTKFRATIILVGELNEVIRAPSLTQAAKLHAKTQRR
jgi:hypothetical protein